LGLSILGLSGAVLAGAFVGLSEALSSAPLTTNAGERNAARAHSASDGFNMILIFSNLLVRY
jgi:hypothetical protein